MKKLPIIVICVWALLSLGGFAGYLLGDRQAVAIQQKAELQAKEAPYPELHAAVLADLINKERARNNLPALAYNAQLESSACAKADDMLAKNYWAHVSPEGVRGINLIEQAGYRYYTAGENLAYGQRSDDAVVTDWIGSTTHERNIVDPGFTEQGMCVRYGNFQGGKYALIVNHFGSRR